MAEGNPPLKRLFPRLKDAAQASKENVRLVRCNEWTPNCFGEHVAGLLTQFCQGCDLTRKCTIKLILIQPQALCGKVYRLGKMNEMNHMNG